MFSTVMEYGTGIDYIPYGIYNLLLQQSIHISSLPNEIQDYTHLDSVPVPFPKQKFFHDVT
jgi:hypothetical protein